MKRITYISVVVACLLLVGSFMAYSGQGVGAPYSGSKEYSRMKQLIGVWEGTSNMGKEGQTVRVEYRLTAGGSAIVETLFPGTPEEMVSCHSISFAIVSLGMGLVGASLGIWLLPIFQTGLGQFMMPI